jgi:predicted secreted protein
MIWFICLMPIINTGVKNLSEVGEKPTDGSDVSAPENPGLGPKLRLTSLIAFGFWVALLVIYGFSVEAPFDNLFKAMR